MKRKEKHPDEMEIREIIRRALAEDIGPGDVTSVAIVRPGHRCRGSIIAKSDGIVAGLEVARLTFAAVDPAVQFQARYREGDPVKKGDILAGIAGPTRSVLTAERTALNFLQRMSGIATRTGQFVRAVHPHPAVILDTRKTAPGLRETDKWAVRLGGGRNHRYGLYDMVLIKENHIAAAGSLTAAVARVRDRWNDAYAIEVEVKNLDELRQALTLPIQRILLDNMDIPTMKTAVELARKSGIPLEASGNISLDNVAKVAATGVDFISVGELTHSVRALDMSLLLEGVPDEFNNNQIV